MKLASRVVLRGSLNPPGDKSIAHRLALLSTLARGTSVIDNFAPGEDCRQTLGVLEALGIFVEQQGGKVSVTGKGYFAFHSPRSTLDAGNSGTTARMVCGLLAAQPFDSQLDGDESLRQRPMRRVIEPLELMGAKIDTFDPDKNQLPLMIHGVRNIRGIDYRLPVASAQVKTAILLAGLHAEGTTRVREPSPSRNHTELALVRFGVPVELDGTSVTVRGWSRMEPLHYRVPGDISSAAFFITAAAAFPGSELVVHDVGLNPTRTGFLKVLQTMGARIVIEEQPRTHDEADLERRGSVRIKGSALHGTHVAADLVPSLIDEIPIIAVAAALADGETTIRGASELRFKESDRLRVIASGLTTLGAEVETLTDGLRIVGGRPLKRSRLDSQADHRMAMAWAIASLAADGECEILGQDSVVVSYPGFWDELKRLVS